MSMSIITEQMRNQLATPLAAPLQDAETQAGPSRIKTGKALAQTMRASLDGETAPAAGSGLGERISVG